MRRFYPAVYYALAWRYMKNDYRAVDRRDAALMRELAADHAKRPNAALLDSSRALSRDEQLKRAYHKITLLELAEALADYTS